jgi:hypothetical protein
MLLILVPKVTNRLQYIMQLMAGQLLGLEFRLSCDLPEFLAYAGPKFAYGVAVDDSVLHFGACGLLTERKIRPQELLHFRFEGDIAFFPVQSRNSALPFDVFAASFYLVSRYEEYLPHRRDHYDRFPATESDAFREGYLQKPLVNIWSQKLRRLLGERYPKLVFSLPEYRFIPTIDIDAAYAFRHKGITRAGGGILKDLRSGNLQGARQRVRVLLRLEPDPFDTFAVQMELQEKFGYRAIYFFLLADYGTNDKNIPHTNRHFRNLIRYLADYADAGIHPSYASFDEPSLMVMETERLAALLKTEVVHSRQHFLRLKLPDTYRNLINSDIQHDYTMGYAEVAGFRASTCTPFYFFDLDRDLTTHLMVHPFTVMDGTLMEYMALTPAKALELIRSLITEVREVGGTFMPLWHNSAFDDQGEWKDWLDVYLRMAEMAV